MGKRNKLLGLLFKLVVVWAGIILLGAFCLTLRGTGAPASITVLPETPRLGEPLLVTIKLNNPSLLSKVVNCQLYANADLLQAGQTTLAPLSSKTYQYAYPSPVKIGDKVSFVVRTSSAAGNYEKAVSIPPFAPQVCSSFISFASFSTTVMSSMVTSAYYQNNFNAAADLNAGLVFSLTLILLLIFLELAGAASEDISIGVASGGLLFLQRLRLRFNILTWILLIIFVGIVYTKIIMILSVS
ncbi:MAG: hypothetical protein ABSC17_05550 [Thermacetogeniaceae bacterium]